jgi:hypothetical protein
MGSTLAAHELTRVRVSQQDQRQSHHRSRHDHEDLDASLPQSDQNHERHQSRHSREHVLPDDPLRASNSWPAEGSAWCVVVGHREPGFL